MKYIFYGVLIVFVSCQKNKPFETEKEKAIHSDTSHLQLVIELTNTDTIPIETTATQKPKNTPHNDSSHREETPSYQLAKSTIKARRNALAKAYNHLRGDNAKGHFLDSVSFIFKDFLINQIIPYWYGTEWDFNGFTETPKQGKIACGYFVSTTLKHVGLNLNRYKLAQQNPENEAKMLAIDEQNQLKISDLKSGFYFVGLDYHVGFLLVEGGNKYFIHSDYFSGEVKKERIETSRGFRSSTYFVTKLTENRALMKRWLTSQTIEILQ
ncbi:MAG: hypothetical protein H6607_00440 [Flavobacteriales bacterium]|nr:hypothetical protein [Flavobacteriales bacterium]